MPTFVQHDVRRYKLAGDYRLYVGVRWQWLSSQLRKLFDWLSTPEMVEFVNYSTETISEDRILDFVQKCKYSMRDLWDQHGGAVVIGRRQLDGAFSGQGYPAGPLAFDMQSAYGWNGERRMLGLKVIVLPWFDGCVVIPNGYLNDK